jgi:hypothetical protein
MFIYQRVLLGDYWDVQNICCPPLAVPQIAFSRDRSCICSPLLGALGKRHYIIEYQ